jgi:hypothetical protein
MRAPLVCFKGKREVAIKLKIDVESLLVCKFEAFIVRFIRLLNDIYNR